ncbi:MAG: hypothetical protein AABZ06_11965 [Bdellovibrionota bacterium]
MKTKTIVTFLLVAALFIPAKSFASKFANQFTEFELPPQWQCSLEGAEWVCQSADESRKRDAIIVLAAKLKGDQDDLGKYLEYLKAAKTYTSVQGKPVKSEPKYAKTVNINGHPWVDALHLESEIPGFYTRYLATVKQDIGVLVTYSINKNKYQQYLDSFENMVKTLKVFRKSGGINVSPANTNLFDQGKIPTAVSEGSVFPNVSPQGGADKPAQPKKDQFPLLPIIIIGGAILFIIWRKRRAG